MPDASEASTPEQRAAKNKEMLDRVSEALRAKIGAAAPVCPLCGRNIWTLVPKFSPLPLSGLVAQLQIGKSLPTMPLVCMTCGNVHFLNLKVLGFSDADLAEMRLADV